VDTREFVIQKGCATNLPGGPRTDPAPVPILPVTTFTRRDVLNSPFKDQLDTDAANAGHQGAHVHFIGERRHFRTV